MKKSGRQQEGFTLIELIVTVAILAILLTIVVVAINPAEQLARSRDAKRIGDIHALAQAVNLYLAQATSTIDMAYDDGCKDQSTKKYYIGRSNTTSTGVDSATTNASTSQTLGTGWAPVRIDQTIGGASVPTLPVDPLGTGTTADYWYAYACDQTNKSYEFTARLESTYFRTDLDVDGTDGGNSSTTYESGNDPSLDLINSGY